MTTVRDALNRANPNTLPDHLRKARIGDVLGSCVAQTLRDINMDAAGVSAYNLATLDTLVLPDHAKASVILRAFAKAGTVTGALTPVAHGVTPATTQIAVAPNGNIVTLAADAVTDLDLVYIPEGQGVVFESFFPVVSHVLTLPSALAGRVAVLEEAEAVAGTGTGKKILLARGGSPAAGQAALNLVGSTVTFATADAVTRARVKMFLALDSAEQLQNVLAALTTTI